MTEQRYHEPSIGLTSEWRTPPEIFAALGLEFDCDPCSPLSGPDFVPARMKYTVHDNGLAQTWHGLVFMNPPFGGRNGHVPWLLKFFAHANGIAIVRAYTSSGWWYAHVVPRAELLLFPRGKTKFIHPDGSIGTAPGHGVALIGMGAVACAALRQSGLGWRCTVERQPQTENLTTAAPGSKQFSAAAVEIEHAKEARHADNI
jgi:DNA N-6-adenine-methyltransferase (Dam)